jgi:hypothetical protein
MGNVQIVETHVPCLGHIFTRSGLGGALGLGSQWNFCVGTPTTWGARTLALAGVRPASGSWHIACP